LNLAVGLSGRAVTFALSLVKGEATLMILDIQSDGTFKREELNIEKFAPGQDV
jgi:hypothetical protein